MLSNYVAAADGPIVYKEFATELEKLSHVYTSASVRPTNTHHCCQPDFDSVKFGEPAPFDFNAQLFR
jgi:hypothetical protein